MGKEHLYRQSPLEKAKDSKVEKFVISFKVISFVFNLQALESVFSCSFSECSAYWWKTAKLCDLESSLFLLFKAFGRQMN